MAADEEEALESQVDAAVTAVEGDHPTTPETPAEPAFAEEDLSRARQFGLDAKDFVDADDLRRTLDRYDPAAARDCASTARR